MIERLKDSAVLVVFYGPMFSGKTSALIDIMLETDHSKETYQAFKPFIDDRGEGNYVIRSKKKISSVNGVNGGYIEIPATPVHEAGEILELLQDHIDIVGIDEGQFLDSGIFPVVRELTHGKRISVVVSGLAADFRDEPFGPMPALVVKADKATPFVAVCQYVDPESNRTCGDRTASKTQRILNGKPANWDDPIIRVGKGELYEARCRDHHEVPGRPY